MLLKVPKYNAGRCEKHYRSMVHQAAATLQDAPTQLNVSKVTPSLRGVKSSYTSARGEWQIAVLAVRPVDVVSYP